MEIKTTKTEQFYNNSLGFNHVIKFNDKVVYRKINDEIIKDIRTKEQIKNDFQEFSIEFKELNNESKIKTFSKKLYHNKKIKKLIKMFGTFVLIYSSFTMPVFANELAAMAEIEQVKNFINFVISMIRVLAGIICSLIAANSGLKMLTDENVDTTRECKKLVNKVLWSLFLIFVGTSLANMIAGKLLTGI